MNTEHAADKIPHAALLAKEAEIQQLREQLTALDAAINKAGEEGWEYQERSAMDEVKPTQEWTVTGFGLVRRNGKDMVSAYNYDQGKALVDAIYSSITAEREKRELAERASQEWQQAAKQINGGAWIAPNELIELVHPLVALLSELRAFTEAWGEPELTAKIDQLTKVKEGK